MKRYKIAKYVDAERMFQGNAEQIVGKIHNVIFGNDGYLVNDPDEGLSWIPKTVFEKMATPAHSHSEQLNMMTVEVQEQIEELKKFVKHSQFQKSDRDKWYMAIRRATQYLSDIQKMIDVLRK